MRFLKPIQIIGATLTIAGSLLPWEITGGFPGGLIYGVQVDFTSFKYWVTGIHNLPVYDYGGALVILLTLAIIFLTFQPPRFVRNPVLWNLILATALMVSSLFYLGRGMTHQYEARNMAEQPTLMIGLYFVLLGSALLLWRAIKAYRQTVQKG